MTDISDPTRYPGIKIFKADWVRRYTGFCLPGVGIFVHPTVANDHALLQHEYGHYLQYMQTHGTAWYWQVGVWSMLNHWTGIGGESGSYWTETDANRRAAKFFGDKMHPDFKRWYKR